MKRSRSPDLEMQNLTRQFRKSTHVSSRRRKRVESDYTTNKRIEREPVLPTDIDELLIRLRAVLCPVVYEALCDRTGNLNPLLLRSYLQRLTPSTPVSIKDCYQETVRRQHPLLYR